MLDKDINIKRLERHSVTQEDFTPTDVIGGMISGLPENFTDIDHTILDNSCGIGNILVQILESKLSKCHSFPEAKTALKSIYGVELMADNVEECRNRIYETFVRFFPETKDLENENYKVRQIIRNRIQWCDSLAFDYDHWPVIPGGNPSPKHLNVGFRENCPSWNDKYPMWMPKITRIIETSLW